MYYVWKNAPKMSTFEYWFSTPTLTCKIKNNPKMKTDVHNYNVSSIQIHLIWFCSFSTFIAFVRKLKPEKNLQRAITSDRKLISKNIFYWLNGVLKVPNALKIWAKSIKKWERYWSFKKRLEEKKRIILTNTILIERSSVETEELKKLFMICHQQKQIVRRNF